MTELGTTIHQALSILGITPERVERWLGVPCGCKEREQKLNQLGAWAWRVTRGKTQDAINYLHQLIGERANDG